jgi:putative transposase
MSRKFCNKYRSESHRFPGWNYAGNGMYFLTLVTQDHDFILGHIANGEMYLSDFGEIVNTEWLKSFDLREELILDEYQIMPNHLHAIVVLRKRGNWMADEAAQQQKGRIETYDHNSHVDPEQHINTHGRAYLQKHNGQTDLNDMHDYEEPQNQDVDPYSDIDLQDSQQQHVDPHGCAYLQSQKTNKSFVRLPKSISSFVGGFKSGVNSKIDDYIDEKHLRISKYNKNNHFFQSNYHDHVIRNREEYLKIKNYIIQNPRNWDKDELNNPIDD